MHNLYIDSSNVQRGGGQIPPHWKIQNSNFLNVHYDHSKTTEIMPLNMPQIFCRTPPSPPVKIFGFVHASIKCTA